MDGDRWVPILQHCAAVPAGLLLRRIEGEASCSLWGLPWPGKHPELTFRAWAGDAFPIPFPTGSRARADLEHLRRRKRKLKARGQCCTDPCLPKQGGRIHAPCIPVGFAGRGKPQLGAAPPMPRWWAKAGLSHGIAGGCRKSHGFSLSTGHCAGAEGRLRHQRRLTTSHVLPLEGQDQTWAPTAQRQLLPKHRVLGAQGSSTQQHCSSSQRVLQKETLACFNRIIFTSELLSSLRHCFAPSTESVHP